VPEDQPTEQFRPSRASKVRKVKKKSSDTALDEDGLPVAKVQAKSSRVNRRLEKEGEEWGKPASHSTPAKSSTSSFASRPPKKDSLAMFDNPTAQKPISEQTSLSSLSQRNAEEEALAALLREAQEQLRAFKEESERMARKLRDVEDEVSQMRRLAEAREATEPAKSSKSGHETPVQPAKKSSLV
jgi:hypothetical protein